jgi:sugar lactone lactonase YvrE
MKKLIITALAISLFSCSSNDEENTQSLENYLVSTLAGSTEGDSDGTGSGAQFSYPRGLTIDKAGNLYLADYVSHKIKKITPQGVVTTIAGSTRGDVDGTGSAAKFDYPNGIVVDDSGNLYVTSHYSHKIKKVTPTGVVTTIAGSILGDLNGTGNAARFNFPSGITIDASGNLYVCDQGNHKIKKITPAGVVTTIAGSTQGFVDANGPNAKFSTPIGIAINAAGNLYVCDNANGKIRKITPQGDVSTFVGSTQGDLNGTGTAVKLDAPRKISIDASGNLYITEDGNHKVKKITPQAVVTTIAGSTEGDLNGKALEAKFDGIDSVVMDGNGNFFVSDTYNHKIKKIAK